MSETRNHTTESKTITLCRHPWDANSAIEIELRPTPHGADEWEVYLLDQLVGEVGKYTGTLDRPTHRGSRIRVEGKRRTLWSHRPVTADGHSHSYGDVSRAEAIRILLSIAEYAALSATAKDPKE